MQTEELAQPGQAVEILDGETDAQELEAAVLRLQRPVEALLFVASESLTIKQIAKLVNATEVEAAATLQRVEADFSERGIVLREVAGGYRFASSPLAREAVEAYLLPPKNSLSTPALETLAIVAYMQPVTKGEIEGIRGVASDSVVSTLLDRGLIAEAGRKDVVGRPMLYKSTPEFLESFGLRSLDDLPQMELEAGQPLELDLLTAGLAAARPGAAQTNASTETTAQDDASPDTALEGDEPASLGEPPDERATEPDSEG